MEAAASNDAVPGEMPTGDACKAQDEPTSCTPTRDSKRRRLGSSQSHPAKRSSSERNDELDELEKRIAAKEDTLRKLKLVKYYKSKHDLQHLHDLTSKWKKASQTALSELRQKMPSPQPTLGQLLDHLQIEHDMVGYDPNENEFLDDE